MIRTNLTAIFFLLIILGYYFIYFKYTGDYTFKKIEKTNNMVIIYKSFYKNFGFTGEFCGELAKETIRQYKAFHNLTDKEFPTLTLDCKEKWLNGTT